MDESLKQIYPRLSSNVTTKFLISEFFETIEYEEGEYWLNIHDKRVNTLLKLPRTGNLLYDTSLPVTTNCYNYYSTTSLWWLVVACSDYTHPREIPAQTIIPVPDLQLIQSTFETAYTGLRNKVITI